MASEKDILDREKQVTDTISTQVRTISVGLLVLTWGIFNASENTIAMQMRKGMTPLLLVVDILSILALAADFLQYVCAKIAVDAALSDATNVTSGDYAYDDAWLSYRAQNWSFWGKQVLCGLAILLTCSLVVVALVFY